MYSTDWTQIHTVVNPHGCHGHETLINQRSSYIQLQKTRKQEDMESDERVVLNVSGSIFETFLGTLNRYPNSVLGCPEKRSRYYDDVSGTFFLPRDRRLFESILYFYQSGGRIIPPDDLPESLLDEELKFFELDDQIPRKDRNEVKRKIMELEIHNKRKEVLALLDGGESDAAVLVGYWCTFIIFVYVLILCIQTLPGYDPGLPCNSCSKDHVREKGDLLQGERAIWIYLETACAVWFALEYVFRIILHPGVSKVWYLLSTLGFIDLASFTSHFAILAIEIPLDDHEILYLASYMKYFLYLCKFLRFLCILKLTRYCLSLRLVAQTIARSVDELALLSFCLLISTVFFSSIIYFCEEGSPDSAIQSIPDGFYFVIVTMVTVGYGDVVPVTLWGKLFGMACAMFGVCCLLALPTTILVSSFSDMYHENRDTKQSVIKRMKLFCTGGRRLPSETEVSL